MRVITRNATLALAVVGSLLVSSTGVSADTHWSGSGTYGVHYLQDSLEFPGVRCFYNNTTFNIQRVKVRFPIVYARNVTQGRDSPVVGWRFSLQRSPADSKDWSTIYRSPVKRSTAFDDSPAAFHSRTYTFTGRNAFHYRVLVGMRWYASGDTIEGRAPHRVDNYAYVNQVFIYCPGLVF
jgi:hypothetical protein